MKYSKIAIILGILLLLPSASIMADSLENAIDKAVETIHDTKKISTNKKIVVDNITNFHSGIEDTTSLQIKTELYFIVERYFPNNQIIDIRESLVGVSPANTVFIKGTYENKGEDTIIRLSVIDGMLNGKMLTQAQVTFKVNRVIRKTLVAVLDLESEQFSEVQILAFSDVFRTALNDTKKIEIASSSEVYKLNADSIQEKLQCTRDECATIIGEQLGVDRVITSSLRKVTDSLYFLTGKIINLIDGSSTTKTVKHNGDIETLDIALNILAKQLVGIKEQFEPKIEKAPVRSSIQTIKIQPDNNSKDKVKLKGSEGLLIVDSQPYQKGASVFINGVKMGEIPANLTLPTGKHQVEVVSDDKSGSREIVIEGGKSQWLTVDIHDANEEGIPNLEWHITALTIFTLSSYFAMDSADKYNDLADDNKKIQDQYDSALTQEQLTVLEKEYSSNQDKMKKHKTNLDFYNRVIAIALLWEGYLLLFANGDDVKNDTQSFRLNLQPGQIDGYLFSRLAFEYRW